MRCCVATSAEPARRGAAELGGHVRVRDDRDGELPRSDAVAFAVCDVIQAERPDVVVTRWRRSPHKDHARGHGIVADALFYAALPAIGRPLPHHAVRAVYFTDNWEDPPGFEPNVFVEVEEADVEVCRRGCAHCERFRGGISRFRYVDCDAALVTVRGCLAGFAGYGVAFRRPAAPYAGRWLPV